ncbi:MAG: hypothetical protein E6Q50_09225 [Lysobacter sp.]|nr:MAG: hypothetical protein E6Q50_09225 [Lysobacter sp.]
MDIDRRSFLSGMAISGTAIGMAISGWTVPVAAQAPTITPITLAPLLLRDRLGLSAATAQAMYGRARRFSGSTCIMLLGGADGHSVELSDDTIHQGAWHLRGISSGHILLADAIGFACERSREHILQAKVSYRWFSGCTFGGATAHLFRGLNSTIFLVTRADSSTPPSRLDVVMI